MKLTRLFPYLTLLLSAPAFAQNAPPGPRPQPALAPAPLTVPEVTLTPAQTTHILKELEKVEAQIGQGRGSVFSAALAKFRPAMASDSDALGLYLDCYKLEHFERKNLTAPQFTEWKERNSERLKEGDFAKALALQLEFLVLSIQAQGVTEPEKMGPVVTALQTYLAKMISEIQAAMKHTASGAVEVKDANKGNDGSGRRGGGGGGGGGGAGGGGQGRWGAGDASALVVTLRQSVKASEFSGAYLLNDFLTRRDWEYAPLNIDGIYSTVVFPYYKTQKPEELGAQWDMRINAELALRKAVLSETEFGLYAQLEQPRLQWQKQTDLLASNINAINALADMLKIIQGNPNHPDAAGWLKNFKDIMEKSSSTPVEKPIGSQ